MTDINISGNSCSINCYTNRWDTSNLGGILETWLTKSEVTDLRNSITPGAVGSFKMVIDNPRNYDATWQGNNTLKISTLDRNNLQYMKNDVVCFVKNISDTPVKGPCGYLDTKIEYVLSSNQEI